LFIVFYYDAAILKLVHGKKFGNFSALFFFFVFLSSILAAV